jgi:hypothetical protein
VLFRSPRARERGAVKPLNIPHPKLNTSGNLKGKNFSSEIFGDAQTNMFVCTAFSLNEYNQME